MALEGSGYLYSLAAIAITFVGFSALVVVLRQTYGGALSSLEIFITRVFIQLGFIVAASAMVPNLLSLFPVPHRVIWQVSSAAAAVPASVFAVTYPARRRAAAGVRTPLVVWLDICVLLLAAIILAINAAGVPFEPGPGLFAVALTIILFLSGWAYLQALNVLLRHHLTGRDGAPGALSER
jgi:hypothetical protein